MFGGGGGPHPRQDTRSGSCVGRLDVRSRHTPRRHRLRCRAPDHHCGVAGAVVLADERVDLTVPAAVGTLGMERRLLMLRSYSNRAHRCQSTAQSSPEARGRHRRAARPRGTQAHGGGRPRGTSAGHLRALDHSQFGQPHRTFGFHQVSSLRPRRRREPLLSRRPRSLTRSSSSGAWKKVRWSWVALSVSPGSGPTSVESHAL
jgi:hypothetical protein